MADVRASCGPGKLAEAGDLAGTPGNRTSRGALVADFNLDAKLDILQINRGANGRFCGFSKACGAFSGRPANGPAGRRSVDHLTCST